MLMDRAYTLNSSAYTYGMWEFCVDAVNKESAGDICEIKHSAELIGKLGDAANMIAKSLRQSNLKVSVKFSFNYYYLEVKQESCIVVVRILDGSPGLEFEIVGERDLAEAVKGCVESLFPSVSRGTLKWYRLEKGSLESSSIVVKSSRVMHSEFYPWIKEGVESYIERFIKSDASILLMIGPPGTGKTSLIKHMISSRNIKANVTYDEELLDSDRFFSNFITGDSSLLVIEDADTLIGSRENGNKLIPRFLNTAEGLVKADGKKMIFTTNLESARSIDPALVRPGRCFDVMKTRLLTHKEMLSVVEVCGLDNTPPWKEEYSLSEIFSPAAHTNKAERRVGF